MGVSPYRVVRADCDDDATGTARQENRIQETKFDAVRMCIVAWLGGIPAWISRQGAVRRYSR
jgi:hypothetical protein